MQTKKKRSRLSETIRATGTGAGSSDPTMPYNSSGSELARLNLRLPDLAPSQRGYAEEC